jgi:hypothetical protein
MSFVTNQLAKTSWASTRGRNGVHNADDAISSLKLHARRPSRHAYSPKSLSLSDPNEQAVRKIAETARPRFERMPGLRSKAFTLNSSTHEATNFYIWDSEGRCQGVLHRGAASTSDESLRSAAEHRVRTNRYPRGEHACIGRWCWSARVKDRVPSSPPPRRFSSQNTAAARSSREQVS